MGNTSSSSKVLGVRVPLEMYLEILKKAHQNKMTITDYVIQILNMDTSDIIDELQTKCRELQQKNIGMKEDNANLAQQISELHVQIGNCEKQIRGYQVMAKHTKKEIKKPVKCLFLGYKW